jgi:hypothetical protein
MMAIGMVAATLALILKFAVKYVVLGSDYYYLGFLLSFLVYWVGIMPSYLIGSVVLASVGWIARKYGIPLMPKYIVFGVLLIVATWICTEFRAIIDLIPIFLGGYGHMTVAALLACVVTLAMGLRHWGGERER